MPDIYIHDNETNEVLLVALSSVDYEEVMQGSRLLGHTCVSFLEKETGDMVQHIISSEDIFIVH